MPDIPAQLQSVHATMDSFARRCGRSAAAIKLVAVSKTRPVEDIAAALDGGQLDFGENYLQEALPKITALLSRRPVWHYIGRIQSNKTKEIASAFQWVQTVDRLKIAQRLSEQRPSGMDDLNVCLQVNVDREPQKAGLDPEDVMALAEAVSRLPRLRLRGLMAIPAAATSAEEQHASFARLRRLFEALREAGLEVDTLSMGMSGDLEAAIAEGSTMVRVGTAIFGARE